MEIALKIESTNVKRLINFIISICFIVFALICCFIMTYYSYELNNALDIITKVISTLFFTLLALSIVFINIFSYLRKDNSDFGYYLAAGFGMGTGIAVECCALLVYPLSTLFFWAFAIIPIAVFAINTTIWAFVCKDNDKNEQPNIVNNKKRLPFIISCIAVIALCIALIVYFIIAGLRFDWYYFIPIAIISPILISEIICITLSLVKKTRNTWLWLIIGLCFGLYWIFEFQIFLDYSIFNLGISLSIYILGFLLLSIWLISVVIQYVLIIKKHKKNINAENSEDA